MTTKYGYKVSLYGKTTIEGWGFDTVQDVRTMLSTFKLTELPMDADVAIYETTHRNYFGKQFKQVSCKKIN